MTNEQLIYWIEGYLSDKFSIEACAIRSKINDVRGKSTVGKDIDSFLLKPMPDVATNPQKASPPLPRFLSGTAIKS